MNQALHQLINIIKTNNYKIITITEVSHFSYSSHTFHYNFIKELYKNKLIKYITSEKLGILDVILINNWFKYSNYSIDTLFEKILPFGGLGLYKIIKYIKKYKLSLKLLPSEVDSFYTYKKDTLVELSKIASSIKFKKFISKININKITIEQLKSYKKFTNDIIDKEIYEGLYLTIYHRDNNNEHTRLKIWYSQIKNYSDILMIGYHLSLDKNDLGHKLKNPLILSMATFNKYLPLIKVNKSKYKNINFWKNFSKYCYLNKKSIRIANTNKYINSTSFEKMYKNKFELVNVSNKNNINKIILWGASPMPYITNIPEISNDFTTPIKYFHYIVFIPKSIYATKFYL